jgi:membrane-bound ClpP family serine protease
MIGITLVLYSLLSAMAERLPGGPWIPTLPDLQIPLLKLSSGILLAALGAVIIGRRLPRTRAGRWLILDKSTATQSGYTGATVDDTLVGMEGIAVTPLRPSGAILVGEKRIDVVTRGEFEAPGARMRIVEVKGNRVVVEAVEPSQGKA